MSCGYWWLRHLINVLVLSAGDKSHWPVHRTQTMWSSEAKYQQCADPVAQTTCHCPAFTHFNHVVHRFSIVSLSKRHTSSDWNSYIVYTKAEYATRLKAQWYTAIMTLIIPMSFVKHEMCTAMQQSCYMPCVSVSEFLKVLRDASVDYRSTGRLSNTLCHCQRV